MKRLKIQERRRLREGSIRETYFMWIHSRGDAWGGGEGGLDREFTAVGKDC